MIRRPPRSTQSRSSAASDVYKRQGLDRPTATAFSFYLAIPTLGLATVFELIKSLDQILSLIHISEPTRLLRISYAVFCLKKKN